MNLIEIKDLDPTRFANWLLKKIQAPKKPDKTQSECKVAILSINSVRTLKFDDTGNVIAAQITPLLRECLEDGYRIYVISNNKPSALNEWDECWARLIPTQDIYLPLTEEINMMTCCEPWQRLFARLGLKEPDSFGGMKPHWMDWHFAAEAQGVRVA